MTKQEIFDKVVSHLRQQQACSINTDGVCLYRGPNNMKCAIGCLISDEDYIPEMETKDIFSLLRSYKDRPSILALDEYRGLLDDLQRIHDQKGVLSWEKNFKNTATMHDLKYTEPS